MTDARSASRWRELRQILNVSPVVAVRAPGYPPPSHHAEEGLFDRQVRMPGHDQDALARAHVLVIGCGGLGSWSAMLLARLGIGQLTLADADRFTRSNLHRQLAEPADLNVPKAHALARTVARHMLSPGTITGIAQPWPDAWRHVPAPVDGLLVGVDNNRARLAASDFARRLEVPAAFVMLSVDGYRVQGVLQAPDGPCLSCFLPNLDPDRAMPCAAASAPGCLVAAGHAVELLAGWLMGRRDLPRWRETSLDGSTERTGAGPAGPCRHQ